MASPREIEDLRKDTGKWRLLARQLLKYDEHALPSKDVCLLESLDHWREDVIAYRQAEWLIDIRNRAKPAKDIDGYPVRRLATICYENRFEFDEGTQEWIEAIFLSDKSELRLWEARRLYGLAERLDEVPARRWH